MEKDFDNTYYGRFKPDIAASIWDHTDLGFAQLEALKVHAQSMLDLYPQNISWRDFFFTHIYTTGQQTDQYIQDYLDYVSARGSQLWLQFEPGSEAPFLHVTINTPVIPTIGDPKLN